MTTKNSPSLAPDNVPESYLGLSPVCDRCGVYIKVGDKVTQTFHGRVIEDENGELGVKEETYRLVHQDCFNKLAGVVS